MTHPTRSAPCIVCPNCFKAVPRVTTRCLSSVTAKLDFEVARMRFRQLVQPEENRLQPSQFSGLADLFIQRL